MRSFFSFICLLLFGMTTVGTSACHANVAGALNPKRSYLSDGVLTMDSKRTVQVIDVVDFSIRTEAAKMDKLSRADSEAPIFIMVNSPGGIVDAGLLFIDAMHVAQSRGAKLVCVSGVLAASMAFNIMAHCDERYTLKNTHLLFHPMRVGNREGFTTDELAYSYGQMKGLEDDIKNQLKQSLKVPSEGWFEYNYFHETLWQAYNLNKELGSDWVTIVQDVKGTDLLFTTEKPGMFFLFGNSRQDDGQTVNPLTDPSFPLVWQRASTVNL